MNVIANEALVRTAPTARNLIISSSGSTEKKNERKILLNNIFFLFYVPVQNQIKSRRKNIHNDNVPKCTE